MNTHEFHAKATLTLENSFGVVAVNRNAKIEVTIGFHDEESGWFEFYDENDDDGAWHAEGSLQFDGKVLEGYDGVFELPPFILDKLEELGYDVSDHRWTDEA